MTASDQKMIDDNINDLLGLKPRPSDKDIIEEILENTSGWNPVKPDEVERYVKEKLKNA